MKFTSRSVKTSSCPVYIGETGWSALEKELSFRLRQKGTFLILCDTNTRQYCLPLLQEHSPSLRKAAILVAEPGEGAKSLTRVESYWKEFSRLEVNRHSLLLTLGGGVISDLGGFVASTWHRGIDVIHIPTTLIGQIDAAIGGKTGINLEGLKNQVGTFHLPRAILVWSPFLKSLPEAEFRSGLAEVAKTALVGNEVFWRRLSRKRVPEIVAMLPDAAFREEMLKQTIRVKLQVVQADPFERNRRKLLNFGHTIGHAMESLALIRGEAVLHGEAVAAGMICETFLSVSAGLLPPEELLPVERWLLDGFRLPAWSPGDEQQLVDLMVHDKKNRNREIRFTLLQRPGKGVINKVCTPEKIFRALEHYRDLLHQMAR